MVILIILCTYLTSSNNQNYGFHEVFKSTSKDTIYFRVMTYKAQNFLFCEGVKAMYFQKIFNASNPDILIMQDIANEEAVNVLLDKLNINNNKKKYRKSQFKNSYNILFYNAQICSLISQKEIKTNSKKISEYAIQIGGNEILFYGCHLSRFPHNYRKSVEKRLKEITRLRNFLNDSIPKGVEFIIAGNMNFHKSDESDYQKLISKEENNTGRSRDLIETTGKWHNDSLYAEIHTHSTRKLETRFDFIFANYDINDGLGIEYVPNSCKVYGNDGRHFRKSIDDENQEVTNDIAVALYFASNQLPVIADFISIKSK